MQQSSSICKQLGHEFDHIVERSKVISFDHKSPILYTKIHPQSFLSSGKEHYEVVRHGSHLAR